ncbi:Nif3-like dinuclear metal center hexameric protein [bacterium]|nr:MAG: Nif3-like dinuclear metal center hexameric protein [bacterium]
MILRDIAGEVMRLAPPGLAESWDRCGLEVGDPGAQIRSALVALSPTKGALLEAQKIRADLLLTHHPLLFKPLASIDQSTPQGQIISALIKDKIALLSAHTNLDRAEGGVNDCLAEALGLQGVRGLGEGEPLLKVAVTVPVGYEERVRKAMDEAGAGSIGAYRGCFFLGRGVGTFTPLAGSNPFIGEPGSPERVDEVRIEGIVPKSLSGRVTGAIARAHPYEAPAIDLYLLAGSSDYGCTGRMGTLEKAVSLEKFAGTAMKALGAPGVRFAGQKEKKILRVAVCGGSAASLWPSAMAAGADILVTGDVGYHAAQEAADAGFAILDAGHASTETVVLSPLAEKLRNYAKASKSKIKVSVFSEGEPFSFAVAKNQ